MEESIFENFSNLNNVKTLIYPRALLWLKVRRLRPLVLFVTVVG
jgi:hypothetical protein